MAAALFVVAVFLLVLLTAIAMARHARLGPSVSSPVPNPPDRAQVDRPAVETGRESRERGLAGRSFPTPTR
jgi:hypothetical protein